MNPSEIIKGVVLWLLYMLLHVLIGRHLNLYDYAFCFVYIGAILILPPYTNRMYLLFIGFITGVIADSFDNTLGMHAAVSVLVAYLRPFFLQFQLSDKLEENVPFLSLSTLGLPLLLTYILPLIFIHHTLLFIIEAHSWALFGQTVLRILCSVVFTTALVAFSQLFVKR